MTALPADQGPALEEHARSFAAFFDRSPVPSVLLNRDFDFVRVNEAYARVCGRGVEEFAGHNYFELYPSDGRTIFEEVRRTGHAISVEARAFEFPDHPEWGVSYWDWNLTPLLDGSGQVEGLLFSLSDVTERVAPVPGPAKRPRG